MQSALKLLLALFGSVCAVIASVHVAFGPASIPGSVPVNAIMDSEDRFYAALFLGFGMAMIWVSRELNTRGGVLAALLAVFFLGGIARIISWLAVGQPSPLFMFLGSLELLMPPLLWWLYRRAYTA